VCGHYLRYYLDEGMAKLKGVVDLRLLKASDCTPTKEGTVFTLEFEGALVSWSQSLSQSDRRRSAVAVWRGWCGGVRRLSVVCRRAAVCLHRLLREK
jgi:hypothetical protein